MVDTGFTHIAIEVTNLDRTIDFYARYGGFHLVHRRDGDSANVAWISDGRRAFVIVLLECAQVRGRIDHYAHLGVACASRDDVDRLAAQARDEGCLVYEPEDAGPPVGYWCFLRDPDGHHLELSYGQDVEGTA